MVQAITEQLFSVSGFCRLASPRPSGVFDVWPGTGAEAPRSPSVLQHFVSGEHETGKRGYTLYSIQGLYSIQYAVYSILYIVHRGTAPRGRGLLLQSTPESTIETSEPYPMPTFARK